MLIGIRIRRPHLKLSKLEMQNAVLFRGNGCAVFLSFVGVLVASHFEFVL